MFKTQADLLIEILQSKLKVSAHEIASMLNCSIDVIMAHAQYLEESGVLSIRYQPRATLIFRQSPDIRMQYRGKKELLNKIKILLEINKLKEVNRLLYDLYFQSKRTHDDMILDMYNTAHEYIVNYLKKIKVVKSARKEGDLINEIESYKILLDNFVMHVRIIKQEFELVPYYILSIIDYGRGTELVLDKVKDEIIRNIKIGSDAQSQADSDKVEKEFKKRLFERLRFLMPEVNDSKIYALTEYVTITGLGMGEIEVLLKDMDLEEIVVNNAHEPIWVYHKKHAWLKTNIVPKNEKTVKHYATIAGRIVNRDITLLTPLLDAHLKTGDRINATLSPISSAGNTITIRKFAAKPWTVTHLINNKTIEVNTAALIWLAIQYELSLLIVGGTGSGKTSTLNVIANFFPPNQRTISIEDTRELVLPETLHWVPMQSRLPNPEGEGGISMLDLVVNSLRQRPDRIIVGEIRKKQEAEVLFEAMHTGHSVYATLHANSVKEAITRLTNPPIGLPRSVLNSLSLLVVQNRNRRTGARRTFQVAELLENSEYNMLYEMDISKDKMVASNQPVRLYESLQLFSGLTKAQIQADLKEKVKILNYFVEKNIDDVHDIGAIVSDYYSNKDYVMKRIADESKKSPPKKQESDDGKERRTRQ